MGKKVYLKNFDQHNLVLEYDNYDGSYKIISREFAKQKELNFTFGIFVVVSSNVVGVFASPDGPIFFKNETRVLGSLESTEVKVSTEPNIHYFSLWSNSQKIFDITYQDIDGIDSNPYDTKQEDVDMFSMLASATKKKQFFINYTKNWV
ncbi:hypothetical protein AAKU64_004597 [Undibacterium sp. GrIS 1.8]|uniref:hypothetical protein n=1 Tax=unclassified Undibacterium TaxID=2630295 RepID=UPI0033946134